MMPSHQIFAVLLEVDMPDEHGLIYTREAVEAAVHRLNEEYCTSVSREPISEKDGMKGMQRK